MVAEILTRPRAFHVNAVPSPEGNRVVVKMGML